MAPLVRSSWTASLVGGALLALAWAGAPEAAESAAPMHDHHHMMAEAPAASAPVARDAKTTSNATITFVCCSYSPKDVTININESVTWNGSFPSHPLRQVTGPTTDTPVSGGFNVSSGTTFTHVFPTAGTFYYQCTLHGTFGGSMRGSVTVIDPAGVGPNQLSGSVALAIAPNPTFSGARVGFSLPRAMDVQLAIYDLRGALVTHLVDGPLPAGEHHVTWDGATTAGRAAPTGLYLVRLSSGASHVDSKLVKLR